MTATEDAIWETVLGVARREGDVTDAVHELFARFGTPPYTALERAARRTTLPGEHVDAMTIDRAVGMVERLVSAGFCGSTDPNQGPS